MSFAWFRSKRPSPKESRLLREVKEFGRSKPDIPMIVAVEVSYLPHGGNRTVWFYPDGEEFDCHAYFQRAGGGIAVTKSRVPISQVRTLLAENHFFELADRNPDVIDGSPFTIAVLEGARAHSISANPGCSQDSPHGRLFEGLMSVLEG